MVLSRENTRVLLYVCSTSLQLFSFSTIHYVINTFLVIYIYIIRINIIYIILYYMYIMCVYIWCRDFVFHINSTYNIVGTICDGILRFCESWAFPIIFIIIIILYITRQPIIVPNSYIPSSPLYDWNSDGKENKLYNNNIFY